MVHPEQFPVKMFMFMQWNVWRKLFSLILVYTCQLHWSTCTYSGIYKRKTLFFSDATYNFLLFWCVDKTTNDSMILAFRVKWTAKNALLTRIHLLEHMRLTRSES
jgi:hypothetical protein